MSRRSVATKWVALGTLLVAFLLAGVLSFYASSDPDGLNRVAIDQGFSDTESDHAAADGPFAGYATSWIDNERLSGGLAGAVGVVVVLALTAGLARVVRRGQDPDGDSGAGAQRDQQSVG
jgi:cobalt/nickel transport system permease protein/cobalt/nickel transport protein